LTTASVPGDTSTFYSARYARLHKLGQKHSSLPLVARAGVEIVGDVLRSSQALTIVMITNITGLESTREELTMPIEDLARSDVVTAAPDTPVADLAATMGDENVGSVVITSGETPVGIVTDRDLTVRVLGGDVDPSEQTAEDVMSGDLCTMERNAGFYEAAELMAENGIRRLPICDGDTLVGIITSDDLNELLADEQQHFAEIVRAQRSAY